MSETLYSAFCVIMCLMGIISCIWLLSCRMLCKRDSNDIITVVQCHVSSELPDKVYSALLLSKHRPLGMRDIYVIDKDVPEHIKILCQTCAGNIGKVHFVSQNDVLNIFQNKD